MYGFLQSKEVKENGSLNNGVKDMIKALEWVKANIEKVCIDFTTSPCSCLPPNYITTSPLPPKLTRSVRR